MKIENEAQYIKTGYYLIEVVRAVLKNEKPPVIPPTITPEGLYQISKRHSLDCITYYGMKQVLGKDCDGIEEKWKQRSMQCAVQGKIQLAERDKLYELFAEAGIRILPLKGCLLKEMYQQQEFRQMADLDILIDHENMVTAQRIMEEAGYKSPEYLGVGNHDEYVKKPWCSVEIHRAVLPKHLKNADKYKDIWERAYEEKSGSVIYRLSWDDFYVYMLEHFAKHLYTGGSGIRFVMDVYVFLQNKGQELNQNYLKEQLKDRELWEFKKLVEQLADNWFKKGITGVFKETEELIITSGIYGTKEQDYRVKINELNRKYHFRGLSYVAYVGKQAFLKYEQMCMLYPILEKHAVLLPFCWIHRILKIVIKKQYKIKKMISFMSRMDKESKTEKQK